MKKKKIFKTALFFVGLMVIMTASSSLCRLIAVKTRDNSTLKRFAIETELLNEKENSIDVLVLGDSECYTSISPYQVWGKTGIPMFLASQGGQSCGEAFHMLKLALKNQSPKVIMVETNLFFQFDDTIEAGKFAAYSVANDYFSILRYHSVWKSVFPNDHKPVTTYKGFGVYSAIKPAPNALDYMNDRGEKTEVKWPNRIWAHMITDRIRRSGAKPIFYTAPSPMNHNLAKHNALVELTRELNVPYYDMNTDKNAHIDWAHDMLDGGDHINLSGAERTTNLAISYLKQYNLMDKRNDKKYTEWNEEYKKYESLTAPLIKQIREAQ